MLPMIFSGRHVPLNRFAIAWQPKEHKMKDQDNGTANRVKAETHVTSYAAIYICQGSIVSKQSVIIT